MRLPFLFTLGQLTSAGLPLLTLKACLKDWRKLADRIEVKGVQLLRPIEHRIFHVEVLTRQDLRQVCLNRKRQ